ncbi:hypothetical protein PanWU01x14_366840, partial [Parasponia andersonii]
HDILDAFNNHDILCTPEDIDCEIRIKGRRKKRGRNQESKNAYYNTYGFRFVRLLLFLGHKNSERPIEGDLSPSHFLPLFHSPLAIFICFCQRNFLFLYHMDLFLQAPPLRIRPRPSSVSPKLPRFRLSLYLSLEDKK